MFAVYHYLQKIYSVNMQIVFANDSQIAATVMVNKCLQNNYLTCL